MSSRGYFSSFVLVVATNAIRVRPNYIYRKVHGRYNYLPRSEAARENDEKPRSSAAPRDKSQIDDRTVEGLAV